MSMTMKATKEQAAIERSGAAGSLKGQAATQLPTATCRPLRAQAAIDSRCCASAGSLKGQAAMEYLVTYGWALLILFIVVAYLLTSGAFSASSFAAQECVLQPDLSCSPFVIYRDGTSTMLKFTLTNGLGFPINISSINYTTVGIGAPGRRIYPVTVSSNTVASGERYDFNQTFPDDPQPAVNDFRTIYVEMSYFNCKNSPCSGPYLTSGRISAIVQKI